MTVAALFRPRRPRKTVVLVPGRERLGLSEADVALGAYPRRGLTLIGFSPSYRTDDPPCESGPSQPTRRNEVSL